LFDTSTLAVAMSEPHLTVPPAGPMRTCIATGEEGAPEKMIRFVVGPEGDAVPDLARQLPGRGMWVRAERAALERAIEKKLFSKAARAPVTTSPDLADRVERLLLDRVLADLGRARRAGRAVAGFVKVEQMIGRGRVSSSSPTRPTATDCRSCGRLACGSRDWVMRPRWAESSAANRRFTWRSRAMMRAGPSLNEFLPGRRDGAASG
jgi:predicted RNA-binding protein YlxR (DUF448 family)